MRPEGYKKYAWDTSFAHTQKKDIYFGRIDALPLYFLYRTFTTAPTLSLFKDTGKAGSHSFHPVFPRKIFFLLFISEIIYMKILARYSYSFIGLLHNMERLIFYVVVVQLAFLFYISF